MTYSTEMVAAGSDLASNDFITSGLAVVFLILLCYVAGRLHQFTKHVTEREAAFQEGYNMATKALFSLATRTTKGMVTLEVNKPVAMRGSAPVVRRRQGSMPEPEVLEAEIVEAPTQVVRSLPGVGDTFVEPIRAKHAAVRGKSTMQRIRERGNPWEVARKKVS